MFAVGWVVFGDVGCCRRLGGFGLLMSGFVVFWIGFDFGGCWTLGFLFGIVLDLYLLVV